MTKRRVAKARSRYRAEVPDLTIDELNLHKQWAEQPDLAQKWGEELADARLDYDNAKSNVEVVSADLELRIRNAPETFGIPKVTEGAVKATIVTQPEYKKAVRKQNELNHKVNVLRAVCGAIEDRKKGLESMVYLFGQQYFAVPKVGREGREYMEETQKRRVRKGIRPKKRRE